MQPSQASGPHSPTNPSLPSISENVPSAPLSTSQAHFIQDSPTLSSSSPTSPEMDSGSNVQDGIVFTIELPEFAFNEDDQGGEEGLTMSANSDGLYDPVSGRRAAVRYVAHRVTDQMYIPSAEGVLYVARLIHPDEDLHTYASILENGNEGERYKDAGQHETDKRVGENDHGYDEMTKAHLYERLPIQTPPTAPSQPPTLPPRRNFQLYAVYICMYLCLCVYAYSYMYICICVCMLVCLYDMYLNVRVCLWAWYAHIYAFPFTYGRK